MNPAVREPKAVQMIKSVHSTVERLNGLVEILESRLRPVMSEDMRLKSGTTDEAIDAPPLMLEVICKMVDANSILDKLESLISRVEL